MWHSPLIYPGTFNNSLFPFLVSTWKNVWSNLTCRIQGFHIFWDVCIGNLFDGSFNICCSFGFRYAYHPLFRCDDKQNWICFSCHFDIFFALAFCNAACREVCMFLGVKEGKTYLNREIFLGYVELQSKILLNGRYTWKFSFFIVCPYALYDWFSLVFSTKWRILPLLQKKNSNMIECHHY